jgi:hypothetical protein
MRWIVCGAIALAALQPISSPSIAGEQFVFPVGMMQLDNPNEQGWPFDLSAEAVVDLRSRGIEVAGLCGIYELMYQWHFGLVKFDTVMHDVDTLKKKLARADSFGLLVYAGPRTFEDALMHYGHDTLGSITEPYFRYDERERYASGLFRDTLDDWVSWVVDSLNSYLQDNDIRSLYRYMFWPEPFAKHLNWIDTLDTYWFNDYWMNIWKHDDATGLYTDSLGVGTLLKYKIEEKDTLHSVWFNFQGYAFTVAGGSKNPARGLCQLLADTVPNPPHQFSFDKVVLLYGDSIGDTSRLRSDWTLIIDSMVAATKDLNPTNPPPVYTIQLQSFGSCNLDTASHEHKYRIAIPEEVRELANLAVLHEVKGVMHFVLFSFTEANDCYANLWDEDLVPFDAPYEEYIYQRDHSVFSPPDSLRPFNPDDPIHDPFRSLPPRPQDHTNYHKYLQDYYQWKYAPYACNYNAIGEINNQLHII